MSPMNPTPVTEGCPAAGRGPGEAGCPAGNGELRVETPPAVPLAEALRTWEKEAVRGVCPTPLGSRRSYLFGSSFGPAVARAAMHAGRGGVPGGVLKGGFARRPLARW